MIYALLKGGLGNQLFQFAAAKTQAKLHATNCQFVLNEQSISDINCLLKEPVKTTTLIKLNRPFIFRLLDQFRPLNQRFYLKENQQQKPIFIKFPLNCFLDGYWQDPVFFMHQIRMEDLIHWNFTPNPISDVAVHFRGGDYFSSNNKTILGNLPELYYQQAFEKIQSLVNNPVFYLFSDTPETFQFKFLKRYHCVWVNNNSPQKDLMAMSNFTHIIIANSSFSFWAAFLFHQDKNTVICPDKWFLSEKLKNVNPAKRLSNWIKIPSW